MPITMTRDGGDVFRLEISGLLQRADLTECQDALVRDLEPNQRARLLILLKGFDGWAPDPNWNDLGFYVRHGGRIERIAIVGDERWRSQSLMFAGADLRSAPVEFFTPDAAASARQWISA
jgi:hypothetical protein